MTQTEDLSPDPDYWNALNGTDPDAFKAAYLHFRPPVSQSVVSASGSSADGSVFYRVAVIHLSKLLQSGAVTEDASLPDYLNDLAIAHFRDWWSERNSESTLIDTASFTPQTDVPLPNMEALRALRGAVWARRQFFRLEKDDQSRIQTLADEATMSPEIRQFGTDLESLPAVYQESISKYQKNLKTLSNNWTGVIPDWVSIALTDERFISVWNQTQRIEQKLSTVGDTAPKTNHTWRNAFVAMGVITLITIICQWYFRPKTADEVYKDNFSAPKSLLADLAAKQAQSPDKDSIGTRSEACERAFVAADEAYQSEDYRVAAAALAEVLDDSNKTCHSDAYFYLAIIGLQMNEPSLTIECLSNIEDLSRYGEDIYWYQALAFVKMATNNPLMQDKAARAVNRVISNTEIPERRIQAEKMLQQLKD